MPPQNIPRSRPPWWPADEPFPPRGGHHVRPAFMRRIGCFLIPFVLLSMLGALTLASLVLQAFGVRAAPLSLEGCLLLIVIIIAFGILTSAVRHFASPLGEVMDAARRVADGDYGVRVREHGTSDVRELARAFNTMTERLQANDEQRRNLMADVAHELRTPLAVIQGQLEGMADGVYPRDEEHFVPILDETRVLARLIEDLRTLALTESAALKLQKEPTDLAVLAHEVAHALRAEAESHDVRVQVEADADLPSLEVDPTRIREVLTNLVGNALRYTPTGGTVAMQLTREGEKVLVVVRDNGVGIEAADLPHIFDRFYKARDSRGSGLGLTIARNLVLAHGGQISAESEAGRGTTIRFTLPL